MRRDMLNGVDVELNRYRHLWSAGPVPESDQPQNETPPQKTDDRYSKKMAALASKLEKEGIEMAESRSYARQAIAAYPDETDIKVLFGYAKELQKANVNSGISRDSL